MACTRPVAVKARKAGSLSTFATELVPCGGCLGCDLERSRQWAVRCMNEASLSDDNCFVTLTYDEAHIPPAGSLDRRAFPLFMKRLRKAVLCRCDLMERFEIVKGVCQACMRPIQVRYFYCGEYGDEFARPHYHALLFGYDPADKVQAGVRGGYPVYRSPLFDKLWANGFHEIGVLTFDSAAYVARYVTKKVRGDAAFAHYASVDGETGEVFFREREFGQMSRRPGIGADWFGKYEDELKPDGTVIVAGKEVPMPRYYRKLMDESSPEAARRLARIGEARRFAREPKMSKEQLEKNEVHVKAQHNLRGRRLG